MRCGATRTALYPAWLARLRRNEPRSDRGHYNTLCTLVKNVYTGAAGGYLGCEYGDVEGNKHNSSPSPRVLPWAGESIPFGEERILKGCHPSAQGQRSATLGTRGVPRPALSRPGCYPGLMNLSPSGKRSILKGCHLTAQGQRSTTLGEGCRSEIERMQEV